MLGGNFSRKTGNIRLRGRSAVSHIKLIIFALSESEAVLNKVLI
jgi:hypothetical protein